MSELFISPDKNKKNVKKRKDLHKQNIKGEQFLSRTSNSKFYF